SKNISFHCARHTFATMALNNGMSLESVSQILGHSSIKTTQIYAKITLKKLDKDFSVFNDNVKDAFF
ncbi:MAG: tyrosine-type recombinase/integrase, partial [Bacteroidales bacterium]|nr:tyrosine-type recombinase/integrase [Bacteroidales bacterium]